MREGGSSFPFSLYRCSVTDNNTEQVDRQVLWQLGSIKSSLDSLNSRFDKIEAQALRVDDKVSARINAVEVRADKLEDKLIRYEARVYGIGATIGLIFSVVGAFIVAKLQHWLGLV